MVKIDLGCHIDGYVAVVATTVFVGESGAEQKCTGRQADVMMAAHTASECVLRMIKPGGKSPDVSKIINRVAEEYGCTPVVGVCSHSLERNNLDGEKVIVGKADTEQKVDDVEFAPHEVYALDIVMSTGEGKPKEVDERTTVFMRNPDSTYRLKMKASRQVLSQVDKDFPNFPFTVRAFGEDEKKVYFGLKECTTHELLTAYPVLYEKEGEHIGHIKMTVVVLPSGTIRVAGTSMNTEGIASEKSIKDEEILKILAQSAGKKKKNKKKKKKPAAAASTEDKQ